MGRIRVVTESIEETEKVAVDLASTISAPTLLCFHGDLGAGKTTFIKALASYLTGVSKDEVSSPTFTLLNIYEGKIPLYHFDLYRLKDEEDFLNLGFDEILTSNSGVFCIEWVERILPLIENLKKSSQDTLRILNLHFKVIEETKREIIIE